MKTRPLGKTKLMLSEIGFGGASIGNLYQPCSNQTAHEVVTSAWEQGIRYFDTAPEYGHGLSERRLGDALRAHPRDTFVLSTKVGDLLHTHHAQLPAANKFIDKLPFHLRYDYSYDGVMRAFEHSLHRLGLNRIDLILVHDLDPIIHSPEQYAAHFKMYVEGGYQALAQLKNEGVIQAIGLGVKQWEVCADALKYGDYDCFMLQGNYTLLEQQGLSFLDECLQRSISILLAGPFASGILATGAVKGAYFHHQEADDAILQRVQQIQQICDAYATPLPAAAIQFPLRHRAIASVVIGTASAQRMRDNINFARHPIPDALWERLKLEKNLSQA